MRQHLSKRFRLDSGFQAAAGGRGGANVKNLTGPPNSVIKGSPGRVYVTNEFGQVVQDITHDRVKPVVPGQGFVTGPGRKIDPTEQQLQWINQLWGN